MWAPFRQHSSLCPSGPSGSRLVGPLMDSAGQPSGLFSAAVGAPAALFCCLVVSLWMSRPPGKEIHCKVLELGLVGDRLLELAVLQTGKRNPHVGEGLVPSAPFSPLITRLRNLEMREGCCKCDYFPTLLQTSSAGTVVTPAPQRD